MKTRIVITGATGFVGSNLVHFFLKKDFEIGLILRENSNTTPIKDLEDKLTIFRYNNNVTSLTDFFKDFSPSVVFHLASNFIAEHTFKEIDSLINSNITFGLHILEAMKESDVRKLINTGTSWQHYNNEDYNPVCLYAATKQAFEALIEYYVKAENFKVITLKLFDTYGETDTRPKLINLLHKFADEKTELKMSPGEQMLNLVHINDVCKAFLIAYKSVVNQMHSNHFRYAIANQKDYKLKEVIEIFESITNKSINVVWGGRPYRNREVMELWNKGETLPGWEAVISLKEGLKKY